MTTKERIGKSAENVGKMSGRSALGGGNRYAGCGILHDNYSEESGNPHYYKSGYPRFPHDNVRPESLNGECIIVQKGRKKDEC